jgi:periplasmic protein TonB
MVSPRPSFAAIGKESSLAPMTIQSHKAGRHAAPKRIASPTRAGLTEEQALHALETEISRKVGLQMKEADYPDEARRWAWGGTTLVKVLVNVDGVIGGISVGKTSGFRMLDEQAVRVVSRVRSPSWIPDRLRGREISVLVPIGFILPHGD